MHVVTGWVHLKLVEKANEGNPSTYTNLEDEGGERKSGVGAAIERLEENFNKRST